MFEKISTVIYLVLPVTLLLDIDLTLADNTVLLNNIQVDAIHALTPVPGLIISPSFLTFLSPTSFLLLYNITLNKQMSRMIESWTTSYMDLVKVLFRLSDNWNSMKIWGIPLFLNCSFTFIRPNLFLITFLTLDNNHGFNYRVTHKTDSHDYLKVELEFLAKIE